MRPIHFLLALNCLFLTGVFARGDDKPKKPVNLLFIMTDQHRYDAMGCVGNSIIKTPNLDRIAREGTRFSSFYSALPTCAPARTSMLTGYCIESTRVLDNGDIARTDIPDLLTFDQVLLRNGYKGEYHGKWHSPYKFAADYTEPVRWLNAKGAGEEAVRRDGGSEQAAFKKYIDAHGANAPLPPGQRRGRVGPYTPISQGQELMKKVTEDEVYGRLELPAEHSLTAFTAREGLEALDRLKDGPFTLTVSIGPPHPPMIVARPYYDMYPPKLMPVAASISDPRTHSPYLENKRADKSDWYRAGDNVRQVTSIYYGMVSEVDVWVGKLLDRLDQLGLADNTLVIFTTDHGEMLGEHGMHGKGIFYQGAVHIPFLMRLPGKIPANHVVDVPLGQIDVCSTILDYCNQPGHETQGHDFRPIIDGTDDGKDRFVVSELAKEGDPAFMVYDGRWKLMFGNSADDPAHDALYDLKEDPGEMNNLLSGNPNWKTHAPEAERLKGLLVGWLERVKSPHLAGVKARPIGPQAEPVLKKRKK